MNSKLTSQLKNGDRTHEECVDCILERVDPPECDGHIAGPVSCLQFEELDSRRVTYTIQRTAYAKCPKCKEVLHGIIEDMNDYQFWCIPCDLILDLDHEVNWVEDLKEIKLGDKEW